MTTQLPVEDPISRAKDILRGQGFELREIPPLVKQLKGRKAFRYARRVLARARRAGGADPELRLWLGQQHALCTYKDPDLPWALRLEHALDTLQEVEELSSTTHQETLGITGAIHKDRWQRDGQKQHLERSLAYYRRGYQQGPLQDLGYTGINAAYVLDLLAQEEMHEAERAGASSEVAQRRRQEAREIRQDLVRTLEPLIEQPEGKALARNWWYLVTLAEAYFGLGEYEAARPWLARAREVPQVPDWEYESTVRQLASLARLQTAMEAGSSQEPGSEGWAWDVLYDFLGSNLASVQTAFTGKVGLALSGGGFRASLFHIGVLARMAEHDLLRGVEVLSCVSGGSIIGAHYYLEVRHLLQTKTDAEITREDYIAIVRRIAENFLTGVQRNIRMRMLADPIANLRMIFQRDYSRTMRVGELFEEEIYARVDDGHPKGEPRWLNGLYIQPKGEKAPFRPKDHNWRRRAKVPILILNATTLNTGHNWQFTASWMGEPPTATSGEVDGNYRLRRLYYDQAPERHRRVRLGHAVAASACVPGLFDPIVLSGLYPERARSAGNGRAKKSGEEPSLTVRLVDGGVHDNQGVASLLEQDCSVMLVSDASGQMESQDHPSGGMLGVPLRSNNILMARVREAQYNELDSRRRSSLLRGLMFVHLKKDLDVDTLDWVNCDDPYDPADDLFSRAHGGQLTSYGILKEVQENLAGIRTDLDSFSDAEAFALMTSGYRMTATELRRSLEDLPAPATGHQQWRFLSVEKAMKDIVGMEAAHRSLMEILSVAKHRAFKVWRLSRPLQIAAAALGLVLLVAAGLLVMQEWSRTLVTVGTLGSLALGLVLAAVLGSTVLRIVRWRKTLTEVGMGAGIGLLGWLAARVHLHLFDNRYLHRGRVENLFRSLRRQESLSVRAAGPAVEPPLQ